MRFQGEEGGSTCAQTVTLVSSNAIWKYLEFLVDGQVIAADAAAPFEASWTNATVGVHTFLARATDDDGASGDSAPVQAVVFQDPGTSPGLLRELYLEIPGRTIADLTNHARFPAQPDLITHWSWFEVGPDLGDNYGLRLRGYLLPPQDGDYVFYMASDDQGALF